MIERSKIYSYFLVICQFTCIALLVYFNHSNFIEAPSSFFFIVGIAFFVYIMLTNNINNFNIIPEIKKEATLVTRGAYRYIRHPMYFGILILMFPPLINTISTFNLSIYTFLALVLILKAKKEEQLWENSSQEYVQYKKRTKMIIPFVI